MSRTRALRKAFGEKKVADLRARLLNAQFDAREARRAPIIVIAGDDWEGCEETIDLLHEWMDARYLSMHFFGRRTATERERPTFWRYWRVLPGRGQTGIFCGTWPIRSLADYIRGDLSDEQYARRLEYIRRFEAALEADGTRMLKFWIRRPLGAGGLSKDDIESMTQSWIADDPDWRVVLNAPQADHVIERYLLESGNSLPWQIIEEPDQNRRDVVVIEHVLKTLRSAAADATSPAEAPAVSVVASEPAPAEEIPDALAEVDLGRTIEKHAYWEKLPELQDRLRKLTWKAREKGVTSVLVFEGWDAAGKGGAIRRITNPMSARDVRVVPIAAPTQEEHTRHYLWRFWRHLPRAGQMLIFDRSWYGRILVERVEGFATEAEWRRAYDEINEFERELTDRGIVVLKFFLHIDRDEQLRRFEARRETVYKKHKITDEDYRNRGKWDEHVEATNEMVYRTSTEACPWHLVPANDKRFARIRVLKRVVRGLRDAL